MCEKKRETTESVTEKYIFFLMPKATREIKKKGEGTTEVCSKKGSREPGELKKKSERVFKKGEVTECVLKGSREPVELKKRESVFKKGGVTGRTKKERGECC